ncbi:Ff.00g080270.m01.CDS01 [Fusarium sp. VM40]|nr:Ff.00g080270.m01.CDS01 [Fusarium sp. VM40]
MQKEELKRLLIKRVPSRIRKVKCDEAKPNCQRCIGTGRKCDGYDVVDGCSQQHLNPRRPPITRALNTDLGIELSIHAFDYYHNHVSVRIGDVIDRDFWCGLVLRLAPTDPAIRHAISAISIMYVERTHQRGVFPNYNPGIIEYNKAILSVRSWPHATESRVKPLLVCLLFICIEFMLGHEHHNVASMHVLQGRRLLVPIKDQNTPEIDIIRQCLAPIYLRLAFVGNERVDFPEHLLKVTTIPHKFVSLVDARSVLYFVIDASFSLIYGVKIYRAQNAKTYIAPEESNLSDVLRNEHQELTRKLANWRHVFDAFLAFNDLDRHGMRTAKLLTLRHSLMTVFLDSVVSGPDYVCDRNSIYDIATAADAAASVIQYDAETLQGPSFTFESEVVGTVYWIATKCRQPAIRRRAIQLLHEREKAKRVETLTTTKHAIAMATRVMEIEEEGLEIHPDVQFNKYDQVKYRVITAQGTSGWTTKPDAEEKQDWFIHWSLGDQSSKTPTKPNRLTAAIEQRELEEGLAKGWPRERLIWPYGITRDRRILSAVVKKHTPNDLWMEYVREPLVPSGAQRVMKEHIQFV